jgi:hypothetical protein
MAMNTQWHAQNKMPSKATAKQRLAWHLDHQKHCDCRPIPASLQALLPRGKKNRPIKRAVSS